MDNGRVAKAIDGTVVGVNGNVVTAVANGAVSLYELAYIRVGEVGLKSEVVRIRAEEVEMQVYERTEGIRVGDAVSFSSELLSVELGPGYSIASSTGCKTRCASWPKRSASFWRAATIPSP